MTNRVQIRASKPIPRVVIDEQAREILFDGEPFPWYVSPGWTITHDENGGIVTHLTVTIPVDSVEVRPNREITTLQGEAGA